MDFADLSVGESLALLTFIGSIVVQVGGAWASRKLFAYRLDQLEKAGLEMVRGASESRKKVDARAEEIHKASVEGRAEISAKLDEMKDELSVRGEKAAGDHARYDAAIVDHGRRIGSLEEWRTHRERRPS